MRSARPPGPIADHGGETREPAVRHQPALDHAAEDIRIDVAAAEEQDDIFAGQLRQLPGKTGGERGGGGAFHDAFFQFDEAQDGERDLFFIHEHDFVGVLARDLESVAPDLRNGEAVGQGRARFDPDRFARLERGGETGDVIGLDRDDFGLRPERFHRERNAREQTRRRRPAR